MFKIDPRLTENSILVADLALCQVRLINNALFPWITLIPRVNNLREITDLEYTQQHILLDEITAIMAKMEKIFAPDKINIAAFGNIVEQLHIHIIARYKTDRAWPDSALGAEKEKYATGELDKLAAQLQQNLQQM